MTLPVFLGHDTIPSLANLHPGDTVTLHGEEGRHAAKVRRIQVGEHMDIVDGRGLRVRGQVTSAGGASVTLHVHEVTREGAPATELILVQALAKGGRDEQAIESATEIGIDHVLPWQAQRSIVKWVGPKVDKARAKWEAVVMAAAKQSRRAWVPTVDAPVDSAALARWVGQVCADGGLVYMAHEAAADTLAKDLRSRSCFVTPTGQAGEAMPPVVAVIVGPEGGISDDERDLFTTQGATEVLLGPHVLRSSSAGAAALTLISAALGRW